MSHSKIQTLKSSFITDNKTNNHVIFKNSQKNFSNNLSVDMKKKIIRKNTIRLSKKKSSEGNYLNSNNNENEDNLKIDDYEDLFLYFLLNMEKIEYFENILKHKKERRMNNNYYFLGIFESLTTEKVYWNNFYFPKYVFRLFYLKSRHLQKEIIKYSITNGKEIMEVINSYNKIYTSLIKIKNWRLKPADAYLNYENINKKRNVEIEKNNKNTMSKINSFTDFVIRTNNKGRGKTLIFLGKTINIYIDDIDSNLNKNMGLSMATEDSEFNTKVKNEIIYTFDDAAIKAKKGGLTINNKIFNHINNSNNNNLSFNNNYKKIRNNLKYMNLNKRSFNYKFKDKYVNKKDIKKKLFSTNMTTINKLPLINTSKRKSSSNTKRIESKSRENTYQFFKKNRVQKWVYLRENKNIKRNSVKPFLNRFDDEKKENKTIINFFSKKDNDFYY
jgi:hypothetical protein